MFSNKKNQEGKIKGNTDKNINKNSNGSNHATGDNSTIKNKNNNIHTKNSTFNNSNNTTYINNNYNNKDSSLWKKFIKFIIPSKDHTNRHNIIIGWASIALNIFSITVTIIGIIFNLFPIFNSIKAPDSNQHSASQYSAKSSDSSQTAIPTPTVSPSTFSTSSVPSIQTISPHPSGSQSISSSAMKPSITSSIRSGYIEFELGTRFLHGGEYLGKDNDYPDSDVAEYSKTGDNIEIGYNWKVIDSSGTSKYGENCSIDFDLYEKDNPQPIDHIKRPRCDSSSSFKISKKGHYIIKAVDSKSSVEGNVEFTIR